MNRLTKPIGRARVLYRIAVVGVAAPLALLVAKVAFAQSANKPDLKGTVIVSEHGPVRIHTYTSPANGFLVNTQIVEGKSKVVIFDGQLLLPYAEEVASYVQSIGKPVDRIILSHPHPDHWSGLQTLTERYPDAHVFALAGVADEVRAKGGAELEGLKRAFGDKVAAKVTVPTDILQEGPQTIDGVNYTFKSFKDGESEVQLVALMPDQHVMLAFDLVFSPNDHAFTVAPYFDNWISILESLKAMKGYEKIIIGHDTPVDRSAIDSTIVYVQQAKNIYSTAEDGKIYADRLKAAFPDRKQPGWVDFSGMILYRIPRK
jgi:glyoxylase-like metal-dependent hydrolase (beta-lactamase superfamily II)